MWCFRPNLLDNAGQGFQIDANFGATAAIKAMLLQTRTGVIQFLPALPEDWKSGSVTGLVAKGDITVGESWGQGNLPQATLNPRYNIAAPLSPPPGMRIKNVRSASGKQCAWHTVSHGIVLANLMAHHLYTVTFAAAATKP